MKRTALLAALVSAAFAFPVMAEEPVKTTDDAAMTRIDPVTTSTTVQQTDMQKSSATDSGYSGCMGRKTTLNMM